MKKVETADIVAWRDDIDKLLYDIKTYEPSRHSSIAITHLEDAQMRLGCLFPTRETGHIIKR